MPLARNLLCNLRKEKTSAGTKGKESIVAVKLNCQPWWVPVMIDMVRLYVQKKKNTAGTCCRGLDWIFFVLGEPLSAKSPPSKD